MSKRCTKAIFAAFIIVSVTVSSFGAQAASRVEKCAKRYDDCTETCLKFWKECRKFQKSMTRCNDSYDGCDVMCKATLERCIK